LKRAEDELEKLRRENRLLKRLVENLDRELRRYRTQLFLEEHFEGVRAFDKELIDLLRQGGTYSEDEILARLGISPTDTELIKVVSRQLEILEGYGLVQFTRKGWKWQG